ncbi:MAG: right-handed parallel beta-helix repeat-containing protein, partial [Phycisphaerales bacterium]
VSGTWSRDRSPYFVTGDVEVVKGGKLVIEPGVKVLFAQDAGLTVGQSAKLTAQGNDAQPIELTAWNRMTGWGGLRFVNSSADDVLSYCSISYAKKNAGLNPGDDSTLVNEADLLGGGVYCESSDPLIENCRITNNTGGGAGAIYCIDSYSIISNTLIANNTSVGGSTQCGGVCVDDSGVPEIWNCTIVNNFPGGLFSSSWDGVNVTNTILWGNDRYQIMTAECHPTVTFCDVQNGFAGEGNMAMDPCFLDPSDGVGAEYDGASANWRLRPDSPCINSAMLMDELPDADLVGAPRIHCGALDLGACENQSDLPLMTVSPSTTVDAGFVAVNASKTLVVELSNTGTGDFKIVDAAVTEGAFSLEAGAQNKVLSPGGVAQVKVRFQPTQEKPYKGTLTLHSNSSNVPTMEVSLHGVGITGTVVSAGAVKGVWKKANSPYTVVGDISVAKNQTLAIEPGVVVRFAGHFSLTVGYRATLKAVGTEQENILFTATDIDEGWFGIRFVNSASDDQLKYCTLQYSHKDRARDGGFNGIYGGAILCASSDEADPGYDLITTPTIDSCMISHCYARSGGAILCYAGGYATITNNVIMDNSADSDGGAIALYAADCTITNNVIVRNQAGTGGGIMNWLSVPTIRNNTFVANKPNALNLESNIIPDWSFGAVSVTNNIFWQNEIYMADDVEDGEYLIRYNDVQGGWPGTGNFAVDPLFADAGKDDYHLKSKAGRWDPAAKAWVLDDVTSPCVDAGDPSTSIANEPQPRGLRVNMGAYGATSQASKSPN